MNTREHETVKMRGSADVSYLGRTVDEMIWEFMEQEEIPGLTLAIVQAPYIPRVVGYGLSDPKQRRLASANTLWPAGPISQAFAAVAVMQLHEDGKLQMDDKASQFIPQLPETWQEITILRCCATRRVFPTTGRQKALTFPDSGLFKIWSISSQKNLCSLCQVLPSYRVQRTSCF